MKNQIIKILPRREWQKVAIHETNEQLVEVRDAYRLKVSLVSKEYKPSFFVRKTILEKLLKVSEILPEGINIVLIEGYRTLKSQQESWDSKFQKTKQENPNWTDAQIEAQVRIVLAKPAPLANHHCGGAVDVTLAYSRGTLLDMGTPYPREAMGVDWHEKFKMLSCEITGEQKANRKILREAMETQDFVWYPGEWWHYSWGDRMWAVYAGKKNCAYGPVYLPAP